MSDKEAQVVFEDLRHLDEVQLSTGEVVNASGHTQQLERQFSLVSLASLGLSVGNVWAVLAGTIVVALYDGGPPGVIYEFLAAVFLYCFVYASLAELASAIPSSAGVYHFASVTGGQYSRAVSFWAGWWNTSAWVFGGASISSIQGINVVSMWALFHPDYKFERWHVFIVYIIQTWLGAFIVMFANSLLPIFNKFGMICVIAGVIITVLVCAIMPNQGGHSGYASNYDVWGHWQNQTGWSSNGFVFLLGMLNGAIAIGTPDVTTHLAEEIPDPKRNIPRAMLAQVVVGFVTALAYIITLFYAVSDLDAVISAPYPLPIAAAYLQATNSRGGAVCLLVLIFLPTFINGVGQNIAAGRMLWTLARDGATPLDKQLSRIHPRLHGPVNATFAGACVVTALGAIYVANTTAFNALVSLYVLLSTLSFIAAILPHIFTKRRHVTPGPFWIPGSFGVVVHTISCIYLVALFVIFCFPYQMPVSADNMNWSALITGAMTIFIGIMWLWKRRHGYEGPHVLA